MESAYALRKSLTCWDDISSSWQAIFASATPRHVASAASAGHRSPLFAARHIPTRSLLLPAPFTITPVGPIHPDTVVDTCLVDLSKIELQRIP